jgi:hypothetical protein
MDRRDSFRTILVGSLATGLLLQSCSTEEEKKSLESSIKAYGRTPKEKEHDAKMFAQVFFTEHELKTITVLANLILPPGLGTIEQAGVPEFIEFMAKDYPPFQVPLRGGLKMLDRLSFDAFEKDFISLSESQQKSILDPMAFPVENVPMDKQSKEIQFFNTMKNLTMTGYYTSQIGIEELGYAGNIPNVWDGVPQHVLDKYNLAYEPEWLAKCIDQSTREEIAQWDEDGNLL